MEEEAKSLLKKLTKHEFVELTSCGNKAIFAALSSAKSLGSHSVLIPDQGGWLSYKTYPKRLGMDAQELATNSGLIEPQNIPQKENAVLLYANPAGYFADQPIQTIYNRCGGKCLVILDVTGSLGDDRLCDGSYADILVGSFGKWKPVNLGYGGFISFKKKAVYEAAKQSLAKDRVDTAKIAGLGQKLMEVGQRQEKLCQTCDSIKQDLSRFDIIHPHHKGINVVVRFHHDKEKEEILRYCERNKYEFTICPRYIRVLEQAISIEVKRI